MIPWPEGMLINFLIWFILFSQIIVKISKYRYFTNKEITDEVGH